VKDTEVTAGLAESNGSLLPDMWRDSLHVTCGLTACTPGSAPGPTLGNEYGKTVPYLTGIMAFDGGSWLVDGGGVSVHTGLSVATVRSGWMPSQTSVS